MQAPVRDHRPLWVRVASRTAALFGVRFYNMLYGERSLGDAMQNVEPLPGLVVRRATPLDLARLGAVLAPAQVKSCQIATAQHSNCFVAVEGEEIAGYSWLNTSDIYLLGWKVQSLPPQGSYTYNSFVRPEFRGRKIFQRLTEAVYSELELEKFQFCCNLVDRDNAPSVAARRRLGAQFHAAPILKLPGLNPLPLLRFPFGVSASDSQGNREKGSLEQHG
jgi:ribosomal protein S18 acetylase RimI-like enzyme